MNPDSKNRLVTIAEVGALFAVLVVGLLIGWYWSRNSGSDVAGPDAATSTVGGQVSDTFEEVDSNVDIPEPGDQVSGDVAVPASVTEAAPNVEARARNFTVTVENGQFTPSNIITRAGDTISVRFTAVDKDYDFTQPDLGLSAKLAMGKEQLIQIAPQTSGKFKFYCTSCGGPDSGPVGYFVIAPKE